MDKTTDFDVKDFNIVTESFSALRNGKAFEFWNNPEEDIIIDKDVYELC